MSHPLGAPGGGRERPHDLSSVAASALTDQDLTLRLIENIQAGTDVEESSRKLFLLHYRKIIGFFLRRGFSSEDSSDLTQDVFSRVFKAIDTFRREAQFKRWLFEIAMNTYRNELRRRGAEKRDAVVVPIDMPPDDGSAPNEPIANEENVLLRDALCERA